MKSPFFTETKEHAIALITYTHTNCKDVWPLYFGQLEEHLQIPSIAFSNEPPEEGYENHQWIKYNDDHPYHQQYVSGLEHVKEDFVIYAQEDFFLYADVDVKVLQQYADFLENSDYSYVRLIRAGYSTPLNKPAQSNLYEVDMGSNDAFSMQATLWKKSDIKKLYSHVKSEKWLEGDHWNEGCRQLDIKGVFAYNGENPRGKFHYDSRIFPYICTGIVKGLWNTNEYPQVMRHLLKKYNIDSSIRGERTVYGQRGNMSTVWSMK